MKRILLFLFITIGYTLSAQNIIELTDTQDAAYLNSHAKYGNIAPSSKTPRIAYNSSTGNGFKYVNSNASGSKWVATIGTAPTKITIASDLTTNVTTYADIDDFSVSLLSGKTYKIEAYVNFTAAINTTGLALKIGATGITDLPRGFFRMPVSATAAATELLAPINTLTSSITGTGSGTANVITAKVEYLITTTSSGTMKLQFASEIAASLVTIKAGSTLIVQEL